MKEKIRQLKRQITVVYLAYLSTELKWYKKAFLLLLLLYAASPVDLIPDFIPVLGMLDDFILIPAGIILAIKMIPRDIWEECREKAEAGVSIDSRYKRIGGLLMVSIWIIILVLIIKSIL